MRKLGIVFVFLLILGGVMSCPKNVNASDNYESGAYEYGVIKNFSTVATINSYGKIELTVKFNLGSNVTRATANHQLQRLVSGRWVTVYAWSYSTTNLNNLYVKSGTFSYGNTYRVVSTIKAYEGDVLLQTASETRAVNEEY